MIITLDKYTYYLKSIAKLLGGFEDPGLILRIFLKMDGAGIKKVVLKESGLQFFVRSAMDVWCLKETQLDRFYERHGMEIQDGWTIVDIGAGLGDFSALSAHRFPNNQVYAYEPFLESFNLLERNLSINKICNVHIFQQAVGKTGSLNLDLSVNEPLQIKTMSDAKNGKPYRQQQVTSVSLNELFVQNGIQRCDLLKLDCEGAEYDILLNAKPEARHRIQRIVKRNFTRSKWSFKR